MKKFLLAIAALFCTTLSYAQEFMVVETANGTYSFPVNEINQVYFYNKPEVKVATCAEVIAGEDGTTYKVRGEVSSIANTAYGNWYLKDETGEIYIYGTLDKNGAEKNFQSLGIEVGDIVTVEGPKNTYKGTVELVNVTVIAIEKQKEAIVACTVSEFLAAEVGDAQYRLTGVISDLYYFKEAVTGFYISDYSGTVLVYKPNGFTGAEAKVGDVVTVAGKRAAYKETPQMANCELESVDHAAIQVSLDEFLTKEDSNDVYYMVTGTVDEIANATYGNLYLKSGNTRLYVYGCYPGWGATGDARKNCLANKNIEVGDQLTIIGVKSTYNEVSQVKNGIYVSHKKAN